MNQMTLAPILPTKTIRQRFYDDDHVYDLCQEIDSNGGVVQQWRENVYTIEEYEGFCLGPDSQVIEDQAHAIVQMIDHPCQPGYIG